MAKHSPMQLSLKHLNHLGWTCERVEHWNAFARVRQDAFGWGDILAYHRQHGIALVQTTSSTNFSKRVLKIRKSPHFPGWRVSGGRIFVHGWGSKGLREEELI